MINLDTDPQLLAVQPRTFDAHIAALTRRFEIVDLDTLVENVRSGAALRRQIAVTFDDGYFDNYEFAAPILRRYEAAATIFVATGPIQSRREFWWDDLERMLLLPRSLPAHFEYDDGLGRIGFSLGTDRDRVQARAKEPRWDVTRSDVPTARHAAYLSLIDVCRSASVERREGLLAALRLWAGVSTEAREEYRVLSAAELRGLGAMGVAVGGHTVNHPMLSALPLAEQEAEITDNKWELERLLGRPINGFAYPYGEPHHFSQDTADLARRAGFGWACANTPGVITKRMEPFALPRVVVRQCEAASLVEMIERRTFLSL